MKTLKEIKEDLIKLANSLGCNVVVAKDSYEEDGEIYSVLYDLKEDKLFKMAHGESPKEVKL